ncbi:MAG: hypothetical protein AABY89_07130, partial [Acidobacteriota bacterium]
MKRWACLGKAGLVALAFTATACVEMGQKAPTSPTSNSGITNTFSAGTYRSVTAIPGSALSPSTCGGFEWQITSLSSTGASGTFKATCGGGITLAGTAQGTLSGTNNVVWTAAGTVSGVGVTCPFSLSGTAALEGSSVRVNYSGSS